MIYLKAQNSTEFLIMASFSVLLFSMVVLMYYGNISETQPLVKSLEANKICLTASSTIDAMAALPGNSTYRLNLSDKLDYGDYTIILAANSSQILVNYSGGISGCRFMAMNISNSTGSTLFEFSKNASLINNGGVITVAP